MAATHQCIALLRTFGNFIAIASIINEFINMGKWQCFIFFLLFTDFFKRVKVLEVPLKILSMPCELCVIYSMTCILFNVLAVSLCLSSFPFLLAGVLSLWQLKIDESLVSFSRLSSNVNVIIIFHSFFSLLLCLGYTSWRHNFLLTLSTKHSLNQFNNMKWIAWVLDIADTST